MELPGGLGHLTYCLNIHPTQSWAEVRAALTGPAAAVKAAVCPDAPFAIGLRFSAEALGQMGAPERAELKAILDDGGLVPLTMNGFPYGPFHGTTVKADVYQPDWRSDERVRYTCDLADLMAEIGPKGRMLSLSTVPGTFKPLAGGAEADMAANYLKTAAHLVALEARTGAHIALAIEPEPFCFLETIAESVAFFSEHLFSDAAVGAFARLTGLDEPTARAALPRHLGLCYDVCHAAVEYEDPAGSLAALREAGVPVHKLQLSAALRVPRMTLETREALARYDEPTYLHQVIRRTGDGLRIHSDLPEALALGDATDGEEWRVHFHVPVFIDSLGAFSSTRDYLARFWRCTRRSPSARIWRSRPIPGTYCPGGCAASASIRTSRANWPGCGSN